MKRLLNHFILIWFSENDYDDFKEKTTININDGSAINFGNSLHPVDSGALTIDTAVPNNYGESTTTVCTRTSTDGENVNCGNCTTLSCQFTFTETKPADLISVHIVIDTLQDSSIEFNVYVRGTLFLPFYLA